MDNQEARAREIEGAAEYVLANSRRGNASLNSEQFDADTQALMTAYRDIIGKALASGHLSTKHPEPRPSPSREEIARAAYESWYEMAGNLRWETERSQKDNWYKIADAILALQPTPWRSMESAPRDGTWIVVVSSYGMVERLRWVDHPGISLMEPYGQFENSGGQKPWLRDDAYLGWMPCPPLPAPPTGGEG
jgi:hypothetical protein